MTWNYWTQVKYWNEAQHIWHQVLEHLIKPPPPVASMALFRWGKGQAGPSIPPEEHKYGDQGNLSWTLQRLQGRSALGFDFKGARGQEDRQIECSEWKHYDNVIIAFLQCKTYTWISLEALISPSVWVADVCTFCDGLMSLEDLLQFRTERYFMSLQTEMDGRYCIDSDSSDS